jgi:hypothetical protein
MRSPHPKYFCPSCGRYEGARHTHGCTLINYQDQPLKGMIVVDLGPNPRHDGSPSRGFADDKMPPTLMNFSNQPTISPPKKPDRCPAKESGLHKYIHQGREIIDDRRVDTYYCQHCLQYRFVALDPVKDGPPTTARYPLYTETLKT